MIEKTVLFRQDGGALVSDGALRRQRGYHSRSGTDQMVDRGPEGPKMLIVLNDSSEDDLDV